MRPVLLVHGAWHGGWCWNSVVAGLAERGVQASALDLPASSAEDDVAATRFALEAAGGDTVLVGHSYGGMVVGEAAGVVPSLVGELVFIAAFALEPGESVSALAEGAPTPLHEGLVLQDDGTITVTDDVARDAFYADCPPAVAEEAVTHLRAWPMSSVGYQAAAGWQEVPSTYVVCTADRAMDPQLQERLAARCGRRLDWPTSHSPFLSRPDLVVDLLAGLAQG